MARKGQSTGPETARTRGFWRGSGDVKICRILVKTSETLCIFHTKGNGRFSGLFRRGREGNGARFGRIFDGETRGISR